MTRWRALDTLHGWQVRDARGCNPRSFYWRGKQHKHFSQIVAEGLSYALSSEAPAASACATAQPEAAAAKPSPSSNTGGNYRSAAAGETVALVLDGKNLVFVPKRVPRLGEIAFLDWVSLTFPVIDEPVERFAAWAGSVCQDLFGHPVESKRKNGFNGYAHSWQLANGGGKFAWGGNSNTAQILLDGSACAVAYPDWELRLHDWLEAGRVNAGGARLTRVDFAYDDHDGLFPLEFWQEQLPEGFRFGAGRPSRIERRGNWDQPDGRGRTLQIGSRDSGKLIRLYEKGKQLGDPESPWVRIELELHSKAFQITPRDLLEPTAILLGAYPCLSVLADVEETRRLTTVEKTAQISLQRCVEILRTQYGRHLNVFRQMLGDTECLDLLCVTDCWPDRLERVANLADAAVRLRKQSALPAFAQQG